MDQNMLTPSVTKKKRGRPVGQFEHKRTVLLEIIQREQPCAKSDMELATLLSVSPRQVSNYLRSLKAAGLITVKRRNDGIPTNSTEWKNGRVILAGGKH